MPHDLNVVIIAAQCSKTGERMGLRLEEKSRNHWVADWAFKINASIASKEGYDKTRIDGHFEFSHDFPGCPYCESHGFVLCDCQNVLCYEASARKFKCPKCGQEGMVGTAAVTSLSASQDC